VADARCSAGRTRVGLVRGAGVRRYGPSAPSAPRTRSRSALAPESFGSRSWISSRKGRPCSPSCMRRFRACCVTQARSGLGVQATNSSRRVARDEEEHVDPLQPKRLDREEITGERAGSLLAQERPPRLRPALGCRWNVSGAQHLAHRCRRDRKPEPLELAGDALIAPIRVLAGETKDQAPPRPSKRRPSRLPMRIRPAPRHQLTVPAQQGLRPHREHRPGPP